MHLKLIKNGNKKLALRRVNWLGRKDSNLRDGWTKTSCLTTWRRPNILLYFYLILHKANCQQLLFNNMLSLSPMLPHISYPLPTICPNELQTFVLSYLLSNARPSLNSSSSRPPSLKHP